ncbi:lysophospholipid acyltransferase family protein [Acidithiobacillus sp. IBUN Pt1247-S3]|uniref:lysophospholipid acyltransferase family protein n=1 Tax=Acidithiobacillus sp. IBUN Pt1247-S3 TaxID=3166642 RepID=UPI0034E383ED
MRLEGRWQSRVAWLAAILLKAIASSLRWQEEGAEQIRALHVSGQPIILAFWHGRLALIPAAYRRIGGRRVKILISEHRDGELIAQVMSHWGYEAVRGSSRRGALKGAKGMLRGAREGYDLAITPDGPRGPREELQAGVLELARWTGLPIVPVTFSARWGRCFASWDRFLFPWPGSRALVLWGEPMRIAADTPASEMTILQQQLEEQMRTQRQHADQLMGRARQKDEEQ